MPTGVTSVWTRPSTKNVVTKKLRALSQPVRPVYAILLLSAFVSMGAHGYTLSRLEERSLRARQCREEPKCEGVEQPAQIMLRSGDAKDAERRKRCSVMPFARPERTKCMVQPRAGVFNIKEARRVHRIDDESHQMGSPCSKHLRVYCPEYMHIFYDTRFVGQEPNVTALEKGNKHQTWPCS